MTVSVNAPPEIDQVHHASDPQVGSLVVFDPAIDDDSEIDADEWRVDGEVVATTETLEYPFKAPGDHEMALRVTDDKGATTTHQFGVRVDGDPGLSLVPIVGGGVAIAVIGGAYLLLGRG